MSVIAPERAAEVAERVSRGIDWLDVNAAGWRARVDRAKLAMHDACGCICGQVFDEARRAYGSVRSGYDYAAILARRTGAGDTWARDCGFVPDWDGADISQDFHVAWERAWSELEEAWLEALA